MCNCVNRVNTLLKDENTMIDQTSLVNFKTGVVRQSMMIASCKRDRLDKRKAKVILPTFCPFCGKRVRKTTASKRAKSGADS